MNEYKFHVNFEKNVIDTDLIELVQNDYNSTKFNFVFDKEGTKEFKLLYPDGTHYIDEIQNDELILTVGVLNQEGEYEVEISNYDENGKLTNYATTTFPVRKELIDGSEEAEIDDRLPILDKLINETDNLNVEVSKEENVTTLEITKKDGTKKSVEILDGARGEKGDTGERGETGASGTDGRDGVDGVDGFSPIVNVVKENNVTRISVVDKYGETSSEIKDGIDNTVSNLINYYLKSETYTKSEVQELISTIKGMQIEVVEELPETGESNKIYLVAKEGTEKDIYNEYIWINNAYELIGNTEIDLTNYYTKEEIDDITGNLEELETEDKTNLVNAINEVANSSGDNVPFYMGDIRDYQIEDNPLDLDKLDVGLYSFYVSGSSNLYLKATFNGNVIKGWTQSATTSYPVAPIYLKIDKKISDVTSSGTSIGSFQLLEFYSGSASYIRKTYRSIVIKNNEIAFSTSTSDITPVEKSFNQTITGKKTFTTLPESEVVPTNDNQFVNKKYVDDNAGGISIDDVKEITGELENLETEDKTNLVSAINELLNINTKDIPILSDSSITLKDLDDGIYNVKSSVATIRYNGASVYNTGGYNGPMLVYKSQTSDIKYALWFQQLKSQTGTTTNIVSFTTYYKQFTICNYTPANVSAVLTRTNTGAYTPTGDYHPATKKYVDDKIATEIGNINTILASLTDLGGE